MPLVILMVGAMGLIEGVISAVILGILTAMGWLAYEHPKSYERMYTPIMVLASLIEVGAGAYYLGHQLGWQAALDATNSRMTSGSMWVEPYPFGWGLLGTLLFNAYAWALLYLRPIFGLPDPSAPPKRTSPSRPRTRKKSRT